MVRWWFSQAKDNAAVTLEAAIMGSYSTLSNLVFRGAKSHPGNYRFDAYHYFGVAQGEGPLKLSGDVLPTYSPLG